MQFNCEPDRAALRRTEPNKNGINGKKNSLCNSMLLEQRHANLCDQRVNTIYNIKVFATRTLSIFAHSVCVCVFPFSSSHRLHSIMKNMYEFFSQYTVDLLRFPTSMRRLCIFPFIYSTNSTFLNCLLRAKMTKWRK